MAEHSALLLTTRLRTAVALSLTALLFGESVRSELLPVHTKSTWLSVMADSFMLHGKLAIAAELALFAFFCWSASWFVYHSKGRERLFSVGWLIAYVLPPVKTLRPEWAAQLRHIETLGLALSFLIALSLLLYPLNLVGSNGRASSHGSE